MPDHHHELLECRNFYRKKLSSYLHSSILLHIDELYLQTRETASKRNTPKLILKIFQDNLKKIKDWNNATITEELVKICSENDISWLDELIKAVFIANYKIINMVHSSNTKSNLDITIDLPNTKLLVHTIYINISRELWKDPCLKYHNYEQTVLNENKVKLDSLIIKTIEQTIENFLPIKHSLQNISESFKKINKKTKEREELEKEKIEKEKLETQEKLEKERLENIEKEKQEKQEKERLENIEKEKQEKQEKERLENIEKEKQEKEKEKNINKTLQMDLYEKEEKENLKETIKNNIIKTNLKKNVINKDEVYKNDILMIEELNNSLQEIQTNQSVVLDNAIKVSNSSKEVANQTHKDMDALLNTIMNKESTDIKTVILKNKTTPKPYTSEISDISEEDSDISDDISFFHDAELF
jgi:hypothetical protein